MKRGFDTANQKTLPLTMIQCFPDAEATPSIWLQFSVTGQARAPAKG